MAAKHSKRSNPPALRWHPQRIDSARHWTLDPVPWYPHAAWLAGDCAALRPGRTLSYAAGDFYIQDAGSLLALAACEDVENKRVCDVCAAPGGKASALAERIGTSGFLIANEPIAGRVGSLRQVMARTGRDRWAISTADPDLLAGRFAGLFDLVLVDAPCSGQALVGRGRQSAASYSRRQVEHSAARQRRILSGAVQLVAPGGRLVYSTCTFAPEENEQQIEWLLAEYPEFHPRPIDRLDSYESPLRRGCYRVQPPEHRTDGAFAAAVERQGTPQSDLPELAAVGSSGAPPADPSEWGVSGDLHFQVRESATFAWPADAPDELLRLAALGPEFCYRTGKTWRPAHGLALRQATARWRPDQVIALSDAQAQAYLEGHPIDDPRCGWGVACWRDRPLGWVKGDGYGLKNHLPPAARIQGAVVGGKSGRLALDSRDAETE